MHTNKTLAVDGEFGNSPDQIIVRNNRFGIERCLFKFVRDDGMSFDHESNFFLMGFCCWSTEEIDLPCRN
jgi:hypothetical protein